MVNDDTHPISVAYDEIDKLNRERLMKVATSVDKEDIIAISKTLLDIINNIPSIEEYFIIATNLSTNLKRIYDKVGSPNLFNYYIKNIDPGIYGRAHTLISHCKQLITILLDVCGVMKELEKLERADQYQDTDGKFVIHIT